MKMPELVAWSVTWDKRHCGNFFFRKEDATAHKQRLDSKFPQDAREVVGLVEEAQLREALASQEAVMRQALEALKVYKQGFRCPYTAPAIKALEEALK